MAKDFSQEEIEIAAVSGTHFRSRERCNKFVNHNDCTLRYSSFSLRKDSSSDGHQLVPEIQNIALLQSETEELGKLLNSGNAFRFGFGFQTRIGVR